MTERKGHDLLLALQRWSKRADGSSWMFDQSRFRLVGSAHKQADQSFLPGDADVRAWYPRARQSGGRSDRIN